MSEMVEKVRNALATPQMRATLAAAGLEYEPGQDAFLERHARAAIEAMREPTDAMVTAAHSVPSDHAKDHWQAMIDAALSEEAR